MPPTLLAALAPVLATLLADLAMPPAEESADAVPDMPIMPATLDAVSAIPPAVSAIPPAFSAIPPADSASDAVDESGELMNEDGFGASGSIGKGGG